MRRLDDGVSPDDLEVFRAEGLHGEILRAVRPVDLEEEVRRLADPACAEETIHWGRNYLYRTTLRAAAGPVPVVVKQFRDTGWRGRWRRPRGEGRARRSWRAARGFSAAGLPTPEPLLVVESERPEGGDLFVTRWVPGTLELRYFLRARNRGQEAEELPDLDPSAVLRGTGEMIRAIHAAGFVHRDLSIGNVLVERSAPAKPWIVDLNRARRRDRPGVFARTRDLARLEIRREADRRLFLDAYWAPARLLHRVLHRVLHAAFRARIGSKKVVRAPFRRFRDWIVPRRAHAHIPAAPTGAPARERIVWDALSDQPHQHASRWEKARVRAADLPSHVATAGTILRALGPVRRRYRELVAALHREPVPFTGVGVALRPREGRLEDELRALEDLRLERVLVRLHPWEEREDAALALCGELAARGVELSFALPQNRELVRDRSRWRAAVEQRAEQFLPFGRHFQVGQAINRSKWGIWRLEEYFDLVRDATGILRRRDPEAKILGPAVIDFEVQVTAAVLHRSPPGVRFDAVSSLLYVDRRGAPENPQLGFDTVGKVLLVRALAETGRCCGPGSWITEVNWPLWEGPHSPAGRSVSVDEETQADYLARFYLLALGTGAVERIFWWQLMARGYGLVTDRDGAWRRRPAFLALRTLARLEGTTFLGPQPDAPDGAFLYRFRDAAGEEIVAAWCSSGTLAASLPRPAVESWSRDGEPVPPPADRAIRLGPSVVYHRLAPGRGSEPQSR